MVLYIVGIGIVLGFVTLLWRQHKTNGGWQREISFLIDLVALTVVALLVGVLVITQLESVDEIASDTTNNSTEPIIVGQQPTKLSVEPTLESQEVSLSTQEVEANEESEATLEVNQTVEPTSEILANPTPSATKTAAAEKSPTPTAKANKKVTSTPKATKTAQATKTSPPEITATPSIYTIKNGDIFSVIAKQFDLSLDELMAANPTVNPDRLTVGEKLIIPLPQEDEEANQKEDEGDSKEQEEATSTPIPTATIGVRKYTIRGGDTLSQIAERFDVTMDEILRANPNLNADSLKLDEEIIIPPPSPNNNNSSSTSGSGQYMVKEGDTFTLIAKRYGLSQQELQNLNPNVNPERLSIGQAIRVP